MARYPADRPFGRRNTRAIFFVPLLENIVFTPRLARQRQESPPYDAIRVPGHSSLEYPRDSVPESKIDSPTHASLGQWWDIAGGRFDGRTRLGGLEVGPQTHLGKLRTRPP